ncbi:family 16 glycoside hydrolase [Thermotoga sp. KOL6]|uniref:family 16 glycoside hydrolase n=1 Tax=Thermotoga sp. KOL6 TaxID=126741 RepID=UPI000C774226|nr:family 16 glycoside hydrolase [Thermotoga sp. KOL6]PLV59474.1 hypothetical protein AS005_06965 [Thermotoga sp. KOL6]
MKKVLYLLLLGTLGLFLLGTSCEQRVQIPVPLPEVSVETPEINLGFKVVKPTGTEEIFEDFEAYGQGQTAPFGPWKILPGFNAPHVEEGIQADKTIGKVLKAGDDQGIFVPASWEDLIIECNFNGVDGGAIFFRLTEDGQKGFYFIMENPGRVSLHKFAGSLDISLAENTSVNNISNGWNYLKIVANRQNVKVYINGRKLIDVNDPDIFSGGVGLAMKSWNTIFYDNVRIEVIE